MPENPLEDEPLAIPSMGKSKAAEYTKILPKSDAIDIFAKFSWSIESLIDHIYISNLNIKLADPSQVKRLMLQNSYAHGQALKYLEESDGTAMFNTSSNLKKSSFEKK